VSIEVIELETASSPVFMMAHWNHTVHLWLKHYVQSRLVPPGGKPTLYQTLITMMVSAFWHGFYPFYYFMFFQAACVVEISKDMYRARYLFRWVPYPEITCHFISMLILNYLGTSFNQLTFERGFNFGRGTYFFVFILVPVWLIFIKAIGLVKIAQ